MSVNKFLDHVLILPEDDANRQLANGFLLEANNRRIQVLTEAGGWRSVCDVFRSDHVSAMRRYQKRHLILLLDFDDDPQRPDIVNEIIPEDLKDRVFLLGVRSEPEALKQHRLGTYENIGRKLANECRSGQRKIWGDELLRQNANELERLKQTVCDFLF